jgi:hypothetical protein
VKLVLVDEVRVADEESLVDKVGYVGEDAFPKHGSDEG